MSHQDLTALKHGDNIMIWLNCIINIHSLIVSYLFFIYIPLLILFPYLPNNKYLFYHHFLMATLVKILDRYSQTKNLFLTRRKAPRRIFFSTEITIQGKLIWISMNLMYHMVSQHLVRDIFRNRFPRTINFLDW